MNLSQLFERRGARQVAVFGVAAALAAGGLSVAWAAGLRALDEAPAPTTAGASGGTQGAAAPSSTGKPGKTVELPFKWGDGTPVVAAVVANTSGESFSGEELREYYVGGAPWDEGTTPLVLPDGSTLGSIEGEISIYTQFGETQKLDAALVGGPGRMVLRGDSLVLSGGVDAESSGVLATDDLWGSDVKTSMLPGSANGSRVAYADGKFYYTRFRAGRGDVQHEDIVSVKPDETKVTPEARDGRDVRWLDGRLVYAAVKSEANVQRNRAVAVKDLETDAVVIEYTGPWVGDSEYESTQLLYASVDGPVLATNEVLRDRQIILNTKTKQAWAVVSAAKNEAQPPALSGHRVAWGWTYGGKSNRADERSVSIFDTDGGYLNTVKSNFKVLSMDINATAVVYTTLAREGFITQATRKLY